MGCQWLGQSRHVFVPTVLINTRDFSIVSHPILASNRGHHDMALNGFWRSFPMARPQRPLQPQRRSASAPGDSLEPYKSPRRKLLRFFEKSRDQWKDKCLEAKAAVKRLQNRVRFLEKSKDRLQHRVDVSTIKQ